MSDPLDPMLPARKAAEEELEDAGLNEERTDPDVDSVEKDREASGSNVEGTDPDLQV